MVYYFSMSAPLSAAPRGIPSLRYRLSGGRAAKGAPPPAASDLWGALTRRCKPGRPEACWEWSARRYPTGYGSVHVSGRKGSQYAHRIAYEAQHGPIPDGLLVCHRCDNPPCRNPAHLFLGTHSDNTQDAIAKGRWGDRRGSCKGVRSPCAKLDDEKVRLIRASPLTITRLAADLGVAPSLIHRVRRRQSWAHVPDHSQEAGSP